MFKNKKLVIFTLVGKGGVGKSTISVWQHQYLASLGFDVYGFDTDPVNATYHAFEGLAAKHINIYNDKEEINKSHFDELIENHLVNLPENGIAVVDNGATSFNAMLTYMHENKIIELLSEHGVDTCISIPIVGGAEHNETLKGLIKLSDQFNCPKIVWLNSFFGDMPINEKAPEKIIPEFLGTSMAGLVNIPNLNRDTFGLSIKDMQANRLTFDEFSNDMSFGLMTRNRVLRFKQYLFEELDSSLPFKKLADNIKKPSVKKSRVG